MRDAGSVDGILPARSGPRGGRLTITGPLKMVGSRDSVGCTPLGPEVLAGSTLANGAPIDVAGMIDLIAGDLEGGAVVSSATKVAPSLFGFIESVGFLPLW